MRMKYLSIKTPDFAVHCSPVNIGVHIVRHDD